MDTTRSMKAVLYCCGYVYEKRPERGRGHVRGLMPFEVRSTTLRFKAGE